MVRKELYEQLKEQGICVSCTKSKAKEKRAHCQSCLDRARDYQREKKSYSQAREDYLKTIPPEDLLAIVGYGGI